ncbi:hypothetical protein CICLE_v10017753mg, partial [Citrus x clementina]
MAGPHTSKHSYVLSCQLNEKIFTYMCFTNVKTNNERREHVLHEWQVNGHEKHISNYVFFQFEKQTLRLRTAVIGYASGPHLQQKKPLCHDHERSALLNFKESLVINQTASSYSSTYPKLDLASSCLYGSINSTSSLFQLVHLQRLSLFDNNFNFSEIPSAILNFSRLTHLNLSQSYFSGQIPAELLELSNLEVLDLSYSNFDTFYLKLQNPGLANLAENLTNLKALDLINLIQFLWYTSGFTCSLSWLANLNQLTSLKFPYCNLNNEILFAISNLTQLTALYLKNNQLTGPIPYSLMKLKKLSFLFLGFNHLSGRIPVEISNLTQLQHLQLSSNQLEGSVPSSIFELRNLEGLDLSFNNLSGTHNLRVLPWNNLGALDLRFNKLQGPLPIPSASIFSHLISNNQLTGEIPPSICSLNGLHALDLSHNNLSGMLPECLGNFSVALSVLKLQSNNFQGSIPQTFMKGTNLAMIDLSNNSLRGRIPKSLANCVKLTFVHLGNNQITDVFPSWLGTLPELELSNLITAIILSNNSFVGEIPTSIANLKGLRNLNLSNNNLQGRIPSSLSNLTAIESMDLSSNMLSGNIPQQLSELTFLALFNVSDNLLTGPIPRGKQFDTFLKSSFDGNPGLCGGPLSKKSTDGIKCNEDTGHVIRLDLTSSCPNGSINSSSSLFQLVRLEWFVLSNNHFNFSEIPSEIKNLSLCIGIFIILVFLSLTDCILQGEFPAEIFQLPKLVFLALTYDLYLTGYLPEFQNSSVLENFLPSLGNLTKLNDLYLSEIISCNFSGKVPDSLGNLLQLNYLTVFIHSYLVSNNQLTGEIPLQICCLSASKLTLTNFSSMVPKCLGNLCDKLPVLKMQANNFHGIIPETFVNRTNLRMIDFDNNSLQGREPKSLANCLSNLITAIILSDNNFVGEIPTSIANLKGLRTLNLSNNNLRGYIPSTLNLSRNKLTGQIPQQVADLTSLSFFNVSHNHL